MHGVFAVRVVTQDGVPTTPPTHSTSQTAQGLSRPTPPGHTDYSWQRPVGSSATIPRGHTAFSWDSASVAGAAPEPHESGQREAWEDLSEVQGRRELDIFCGNPVGQTVRGRVHLYARRYDLAGGDASPNRSGSPQVSSSSQAGPHAGGAGDGLTQPQPLAGQQYSQQRHYSLFVLAVPSYLTPADFCNFVGPDLMQTVLHMRVVRDEDPSRYMVLLQMRDHNAAEELRQMKNGARFSMLMGAASGAVEEAETCYVLYVEQLFWEQPKSVDDSDGSDRGRPAPTCDGDLAVSLAVSTNGGDGSVGSGRVSPTHTPGQAKALSAPPLPGHVEVPRCPVCLDRLDPHASGILTVLCNHSFHSECLTKWGDSTCPVCRFCQQPEPLSTCAMCGLCNDTLWMCLVCGFVGCGRYQEHHALDHHNETGHNYAIELATQRVWDYTGDCYVHRLIQNRVDGKMVEFGDPNDYGDEQSGKLGEALAKSKHEQVIQEYEMLLTSTLDSQRHFYDSQLSMLAADHERCKRRLSAMEKKCAEQAAALASAEADRTFMEQVNGSMKANQSDWQSRAETSERRVQELEEQVRDLMFFLEAQKTIEGSTDVGGASELAGGNVGVVTKPTRGKKKKKR